MKEDYQKALKKATSFFPSHLVPFNRQNYQKQKNPGTTEQSFFMLKNKFRKIPLLVMYYLTKFDDVIQSSFWVTSKNSDCPFESGKCEKEGKKIQKFEYLENQKSFLDEIKNIFHSFWRPIIWWKNKKLIKNSGHKL